MRAVLTNFGSRGDFQPLAALAFELAKREFQPVFAVPVAAEGFIGTSNFEVVTLGPDLSDIRDQINLSLSTRPESYSSSTQLLELLKPLQPYFQQIFNQLAAVCRGAAVLISGPAQPLARMVHETTGVPFVSVQLCHFGGHGGPYLREVGDHLINPFRQKLGLSRIRDPLTTGTNSPQLALYAMSAHLRPVPEDWPQHYHVTGFFFHPEPGTPNPSLQTFVASGPAPVVISFGSMIHSQQDRIRDVVVDAIGRTHCRAVVQTLGHNPVCNGTSDIYWAENLPHDWLFPRAACVVTHGGAGTSAAIFKAGVPGIFVPHGDFYDQRYWAELAHDLGCAVEEIPYPKLSAEKLAAAICESMENADLRSAAADLAAKIQAEKGVRFASQLIESLVRDVGLEEHVNALDASC